jgi:hypothetical protein
MRSSIEQTGRWTDYYRNRQADVQTIMEQAGRWTDYYGNRQTGGQTITGTGRQMDRLSWETSN